MTDLPEKEYLERQKLVAELNKLGRDAKYELFRLLFAGFQSVALIFGVFVAVNEFVIKDRAQKTQQQSIALTLVERGDSAAVRKARDSLNRLYDEAYAVPVDRGIESQRFPGIVARFNKETHDLAAYYRALDRAIRAGYVDPELLVALLADDIQSTGHTLDEMLGRMGYPGTKSVNPYPDIRPYCSFYALRNRLDPRKFWARDWGGNPC